jgi:hypothetical protein
MPGEAYLSNSVKDEYAERFLATELVLGERQPEGTERLSASVISFERQAQRFAKQHATHAEPPRDHELRVKMPPVHDEQW